MSAGPVTYRDLRPAAGDGSPRRVPGRLAALGRALKQVFGIPDFERYCEHLREAHPGTPLPTEREFHAMAIDRRYGAARPRCC